MAEGGDNLLCPRQVGDGRQVLERYRQRAPLKQLLGHYDIGARHLAQDLEWDEVVLSI